jgi:hypothetical protein
MQLALFYLKKLEISDSVLVCHGNLKFTIEVHVSIHKDNMKTVVLLSYYYSERNEI